MHTHPAHTRCGIVPACASPAPRTPVKSNPTPPTPLGHRVAAALLSAALMLAEGPAVPPPSAAVLNSPNARIARSADAALRRSVPGFNADVKDVQAKLEVWYGG